MLEHPGEIFTGGSPKKLKMGPNFRPKFHKGPIPKEFGNSGNKKGPLNFG